MSLTNEDLEPVPAEKRTWSTSNYAALWIGMSICIPTYMLASGLISQGADWVQALAAVALGNLIVLVPMLLNGHAGARYGIPFPVFARASFGTRGANLPALLRAFVACGWFGINTWFGGVALSVVLEKTVWPGIRDTTFIDEALGTAEKGPVPFSGKVAPGTRVTVNGTAVEVAADGVWKSEVPRNERHELEVVTVGPDGEQQKSAQKIPVGIFDLRVGHFLCFLAFWALNMVVVWYRIDFIKKLLIVKSVFLPLATLALLAWALSIAGFGQLFDKPSKFETAGQFWKFFVPAVTGMVGFWATLSLNIPDFTRYASSQRAQVTGQALGLPTSMTAMAFVSVAVTSATVLLPAFGGQPEWDLMKVVAQFDSTITVAFAMLCIVISTLATNIAANIVSPANDFANLAPSVIGFRAGGLITGIFGICMVPWKLVEDPNGYIFSWLIGYSALLGPIGGILIVDYFVLRKRELDVEDLYRHEGRYGYASGWNPVALAALVIGIAPCVPGFLNQVKLLDLGQGSFWAGLYNYAWFVGFAVSGLVYWGGMQLQGVPGAVAPREQETGPGASPGDGLT